MIKGLCLMLSFFLHVSLRAYIMESSNVCHLLPSPDAFLSGLFEDFVYIRCILRDLGSVEAQGGIFSFIFSHLPSQVGSNQVVTCGFGCCGYLNLSVASTVLETCPPPLPDQYVV